ncbi:uncharacterized protein BDR25DRAFT_331759 [Lindgomyces ingoldianus]|uniref:Uncharacterized protein n=1 Tax=Lindgomyces ingoldianus TaxID=673940 RepID=A0ACB6R7F3_9PLEO|nr:uncharacterized protein BDR25DRAFT_331759 [Lindgomyces ingoldianus]KAF2475184.1 hypothetical protein BDR25DRAFT_331759 [Lindgomyces ingoldianus]
MGYGVYHSRAGIVVGTLALQLISSTCVILRFYTRFWKRQPVLISDWLVLVAWVCGSGLSVMEIYGVAVNAFAVPLNTTSHLSQGLNERLKNVQHMEYAFVLTGVFSIGLVKLSVCLLYWHLFAKVKIRRFLAVWIAIIVTWTVAFLISEFLECGTHPLKVFGTKQDLAKYCPHIHKIGYALVGSDVATDLITLLIPLPLVMGMRLPWTRKILLAATFLVGALAVGASTAKAYIYIASSLAMMHEDGIILVTAYSMWNLVEVHVSITAACGMTLRPILGRIFPTDRFTSFIRFLRSSCNRKKTDQFSDLPSFVKIESGPDQNSRNPENTEPEKKEYEQQELVFQTSALAEVV